MKSLKQMVSENFYYSNGNLFNKKNRGAHAKANQVAGHATSKGYLRVEILGKSYYAHRLIWILCNGQLKDSEFIDHINGVKTDNKVENLRVVDKAGNNQNLRQPKLNNKSGFLGVYKNKKTLRFETQIGANGKKTHIGTFDSAESANSAYLLAKRQLHETCSV